jgi:hypothetical protein
LDKFESLSSDGIFLGYTPHGRSYKVLNLETNTVVESCDVTFDETAHCPHDVFENAGDKKMEQSIFVDEEHIAPVSTSSPGPIPASTLEEEAPQVATSSSAEVQASGTEGGGQLLEWSHIPHSEGTSTSVDHR